MSFINETKTIIHIQKKKTVYIRLGFNSQNSKTKTYRNTRREEQNQNINCDSIDSFYSIFQIFLKIIFLYIARELLKNYRRATNHPNFASMGGEQVGLEPGTRLLFVC